MDKRFNLGDQISGRIGRESAYSQEHKSSEYDNEQRKYGLIELALETISKEPLSEAIYKKAIGILVEAYSSDDGFRHRYSLITHYLTNLGKSNPEAVKQIASNLEEIVYRCADDVDCKMVKNNLFKLLDHVRLEYVRLADLLDTAENIRILNEFKGQFETFEKSFSIYKDEAQSLKKEYTTILGIFASIVIGFVGVFSFTSAMFAGFSNTELRVMGVAVSVGALFVGNVLFLLFEMIREINDKKSVGFPKKLIVCFNVFFVALGVVAYCWF